MNNFLSTVPKRKRLHTLSSSRFSWF